MRGDAAEAVTWGGVARRWNCPDLDLDRGGACVVRGMVELRVARDHHQVNEPGASRKKGASVFALQRHESPRVLLSVRFAQPVGLRHR